MCSRFGFNLKAYRDVLCKMKLCQQHILIQGKGETNLQNTWRRNYCSQILSPSNLKFGLSQERWSLVKAKSLTLYFSGFETPRGSPSGGGLSPFCRPPPWCRRGGPSIPRHHRPRLLPRPRQSQPEALARGHLELAGERNMADLFSRGRPLNEKRLLHRSNHAALRDPPWAEELHHGGIYHRSLCQIRCWWYPVYRSGWRFKIKSCTI